MQDAPNPPVRDIFATQGILVVLVALLLCILNLTAPAFCAALVQEWQRIAEESPTLEALWAQLLAWGTQWFATQ